MYGRLAVVRVMDSDGDLPVGQLVERERQRQREREREIPNQ